MKRFHIMLDVDGVLITGRPEDGAFWATDLKRDLGIDPEALQTHFFKPFWADIVRGYRDLKVSLDERWGTLETNTSLETFIDYWFSQDARIDGQVLADCDMLRRAGHSVHLATNQEHTRADYIMRTLGAAAHVDGIFYSAALGVCKPEPAYFAIVSDKIDAAPEDILLIDDTPANVAAARTAGWRAFEWTPAHSLAAVVAAQGAP